MSSFILCNLPILLSTVKLKFSKSSLDSKLGLFVLVLGYTSKLFPINKDIFGFLNVAPAGLFFPIQEKNETNKFLEYKPRLHFQISPNSLKSEGTGIFEAPMISFC